MDQLDIDTPETENWSQADLDLLWDDLTADPLDDIEKARGRADVKSYMRGGHLVRQHGRGFEAKGPEAPKAPKARTQPHAKPGSKTKENEQSKVPVRREERTPKRDNAYIEGLQGKPVKARDAEAKPRTAIRAEIERTCGKRNDRKYSDDPNKAVDQRLAELAHLTDRKNVMKAKQGLNDLADALTAVGADKAKVKAFVLDATDTLMAQEHEALGRTLGDHGIRHLLTDAEVGTEILKKAGDSSPESRAIMLIAGIYHDTGYLTEPSRKWADFDHPHWSKEHYEANVRQHVERTLGKPVANELRKIIATHDQTHMDWQGNPRASAFRLADNLGLFHNDKLPAVLYNVPKNVDVLVRLGRKEISLDDARKQVRDNVEAGGFNDSMKRQLLKAADEISPTSPKFTIGMVGTKLAGIKWKGDHPEVKLKRTSANAELSKVLDLGQRQFKKFAETYLGEKAGGNVRDNDHLEFRSGGKIALEMDFETAIKKMLAELLERGLI